MTDTALVLAYAGCDTCRKALAWLKAQNIPHTVRPIVESPPTLDELQRWVPLSGLAMNRWLNTSGQSYRALDRAVIDASTDADWLARLTSDGKLVKRPVLVRGNTVLVGFKPDAWRDALCP